MQHSRFQRHTDDENTICSIRMHQNLPFFMKNRPKKAFFWSKVEFFGFRQAVEDPPPPILRVLDANKQVVGAHRSQKHNLQHVYAPKFGITHGKNGCFLVKN